MESITPRNENVQNVSPDLDPSAFTRLKSGANWFYWIAVLSLVNSLIFAFGGQISFILGLAFTQLIDAVAEASGSSFTVRIVAVVVDLVVVAVFALLGYYANKGMGVVFIVGMVIYVVDGLIWLMLGSYLAAAFHAFALFMIFRGLLASREIAGFKANPNAAS